MEGAYSAWNFYLLLTLLAVGLVLLAVDSVSLWLEWGKRYDTAALLRIGRGYDQLMKINATKATSTLDSIRQESVGAVAEIKQMVTAMPAGPAGEQGRRGERGEPGRNSDDTTRNDRPGR